MKSDEKFESLTLTPHKTIVRRRFSSRLIKILNFTQITNIDSADKRCEGVEKRTLDETADGERLKALHPLGVLCGAKLRNSVFGVWRLSAFFRSRKHEKLSARRVFLFREKENGIEMYI